jgi:hypothetical protein
MRLTEVARELYALPPDRFTAERNRRATAARGDDKRLASEIRALPKPSAAAWLVDMLVIHRVDLVEQALDLGATMRDAQDDLDEVSLRRLGRERRRLVAALARESLAVAEELGHPVGAAAAEAVEQTLLAAMADAAAADAVRTALLVRALEPAGFDAVDLDGAIAVTGAVPAAKPKKQAAAAKKKGPSKREIETADRAADAAEKDAARAERTRKKAESAVADSRERRGDLEAELSDLEARIDALAREIDAADEEERRLEQERREAERVADRERRRADDARAEADRLRDVGK